VSFVRYEPWNLGYTVNQYLPRVLFAQVRLLLRHDSRLAFEQRARVVE
jgi:hypothetical protein